MNELPDSPPPGKHDAAWLLTELAARVGALEERLDAIESARQVQIQGSIRFLPK